MKCFMLHGLSGILVTDAGNGKTLEETNIGGENIRGENYCRGNFSEFGGLGGLSAPEFIRSGYVLHVRFLYVFSARLIPYVFF